MGILLDDLIRMVPSDTEQRVGKAKDRLNEPIRGALRQEMELRLNRSEKAGGGSRSKEQASVKILVRPGLPEALRGRELDEDLRLVVMLAPYANVLRRLKDSGREIDGVIEEWMQHPRGREIIEGGEYLPGSVASLAEALLREAQRFSIARWILEVNEDALGAYFFDGPGEPHLPLDAGVAVAGRVDLYWGIIGLVGRLLDVTVEDLTAVVLAHELGHAYTHLGLDINMHRWSITGFQTAERRLKEGLAQVLHGQGGDASSRKGSAHV